MYVKTHFESGLSPINIISSTSSRGVILACFLLRKYKKLKN